MSKIIKAIHKEWRIGTTADSIQKCVEQIGCENADELDIMEMEKTEYLLSNVPYEFRGVLSGMAYRRGHSAGQAEVELILEELIDDLLPAIETFENNLLAATCPL